MNSRGSARDRAEAHKKSFKSKVTAEESRRKREETAIEIRKTKKEESLQKRRNITVESSNDNSAVVATSAEISSIPIHAQRLFSNDLNGQLESTIAIRKLLSIEKNPPITQVIEAGIVPRLVQFLVDASRPKLQFEAAWALTNIASGTSDQTQLIVRSGAVPIFIQLLASPDEELREQAVWALGNIAGDSPQCRDFIIGSGFMEPLLFILSQQNNRQTMQRNATWALSNLCRGKPQPKFNLVSPALPTLARLLLAPDQEVVIDAAWALSYLSDGQDSNIQAVLNAGVGPRLIELLQHANYAVQTPALRTIGNIVTGTDEQTQSIIDLQGLPAIGNLLSHPRKALRKEAAWALSNITAGNKNQTSMVMQASLIPPLVNLLNSSEYDVKKEAAWAISNATTWKVPEQIQHLAQCGCIQPLCDLLKTNDSKVILVAIEALENILEVGEGLSAKLGKNPYCDLVEEADGLDSLDSLQSHENTEIYNRVVKILETYFQAEAENVAPSNQTPNQTFSFSAPQTIQGGFRF